ncbi:McrC family protein [Kitasatospora sp. NPDC006697]|uniref:McrC family protein n=1 Tax=Kitasatospora sp. NPDC006697 TaxID=3364020 RepID=UPI0036AA9C6A
MSSAVRFRTLPGLRIELTEGGGWVRRTLTPTQAAILSESELVQVRPTRWSMEWDLKPKDMIGAVQLGRGEDTVQLRLRPKVLVDRLLYLLQYAAKRADWRPEPVEADDRPDLVPAIAYAFVAAADRALIPGVLLGYQEVQDSLPVLRGRLLVGEQLRRRPGQPLPLEVSYDEHTADIPENQILLGAARQLLRLPDLAPAMRARLCAIVARLDGVTPVGPGRALPRWNADRLNARYLPALALAQLILRGGSYELEDGRSVLVDGLLLRMWQVFEDFIGAAVGAELDEQHRSAYSHTPDKTRYLDRRSRYILLPDLVHYRPSAAGLARPYALVDAKYKRTHSRDDLYQILAYCLRFGLTEGHLVYAGGPTNTVEIPLADGHITIHRHPIDLAAPQGELQGSIQLLAARIQMASQGGD